VVHPRGLPPRRAKDGILSTGLCDLKRGFFFLPGEKGDSRRAGNAGARLHAKRYANYYVRSIDRGTSWMLFHPVAR